MAFKFLSRNQAALVAKLCIAAGRWSGIGFKCPHWWRQPGSIPAYINTGSLVWSAGPPALRPSDKLITESPWQEKVLVDPQQEEVLHSGFPVRQWPERSPATVRHLHI